MSYTVYSSPGIVVARTLVSEASVFARIFTRDFGMISVRAVNGARSNAFAPAMQLGTVAQYDVVRGKHAWKLVGVRHARNAVLSNPTEQRISFIRLVCTYVMRFASAEEDISVELYDLLINTLAHTTSSEPKPGWWDSFRYKFLQELGYIESENPPTSVTELKKLLTDAESRAQL